MNVDDNKVSVNEGDSIPKIDNKTFWEKLKFWK